MNSLRYLLLQIRDAADDMRGQEVRRFSTVLHCDQNQIEVCDLLAETPSDAQLDRCDMILIGGSGKYSAAAHNEWLEGVLDCLRDIYHTSKPMFASCWGFQALARALGGRCIHDPPNAELGSIELHLTAAGAADPVFGQLPQSFRGQAGHEDHVVGLPPDAVLLVSSARVAHQAFTFADRPIYCTQFHPELDRESLLTRIRAYPEYAHRIAGLTVEEFALQCRDSPEANKLLRNFVRHVFG